MVQLEFSMLNTLADTCGKEYCLLGD